MLIFISNITIQNCGELETNTFFKVYDYKFI